jgi:hypothetical protein
MSLCHVVMGRSGHRISEAQGNRPMYIADPTMAGSRPCGDYIPCHMHTPNSHL